MKANVTMLAAFLAITGSASAQSGIDIVPKTVNRTLPDEPGFTNDTEYKRKFEEVSAEMEAIKRKAEDAQRKLLEAKGNEPSPEVQSEPQPVEGSTGEAQGALPPANTPPNASKAARKGRTSRVAPQVAPSMPTRIAVATEAKFFGTSQTEEDESLTVLPTGSFVRAKVVSGVESVSTEPYPVLLQLDHGFAGPNKTRIDLSNCFMIAKARANLSTERVIMESDSLSCVRDNGEHFKTIAKGYVAGSDNSFGAMGKFQSKQGQVLLAAVLASIAKNAGQAVAAAQQTTSVLGSDKAATATNVTGSKAAFVAGSSLVDGASMVAQFYLEHAKGLLPSIAVGSGADVTVIMLDSVKVPTLRDADTFPWSKE